MSLQPPRPPCAAAPPARLDPARRARRGGLRAPHLLAFWMLFLAADDTLWFRVRGYALHWDSAIHLTETLHADRLAEVPAGRFLERLVSVSWYYPPLVSFAAVPFQRLLGESERSALHTLTFFLLLLVLGTYALGTSLFGTTAGLLAAVGIACMPMTLWLARDFLLDLPLAALTALGLWCLVRTRDFASGRYALLLGLGLGCGLLAKWTFPIFVGPPLVLAALRASAGAATPGGIPPAPSPIEAAREEPPVARRRRLMHVLVALAVGAMIAAPWYLAHVVQILTRRSGQLHQDTTHGLAAWTYYLRILPDQTSWLLGVVLVAGLALHIRRCPHRARAWFGFVVSLALLSGIGFRQPRFSMPLLVPLVVMAAGGLATIAPRRRRHVVLFAIVALGILQRVVLSYVPAASRAGRWTTRLLAAASPQTFVESNPRDWRVADIVDTVHADRERRGNPRAVLRVLPDRLHFNNAVFAWEAGSRREPLAVQGTSGFPMLTDYVLLASGDPGFDPAGVRARLTREVLADSSLFHPLSRFPLPDGSVAILLRVEPTAAAGRQAELRSRALRAADVLVRRWFRPIEGYDLQVESRDSLQLAHGRIERLRLRLGRAEMGDFAFQKLGLEIRDLVLEARGVRLDLQPGASVTQRAAAPRVLGLDTLRVESLVLRAADLRRWIEQAAPGVTLDHSGMQDGILRLAGRARGLPGRFELAVHLGLDAGRDLRFEIRSARIGAFRIPAVLLDFLLSAYEPLGLDGGAVAGLWIAPLSVAGDRLVLGAAAPMP